MNAHSFTMINVFTAFGFYLMHMTGIFGSVLSKPGSIFSTFDILTKTFTIPVINVPFSGIEALAIVLAGLTVVVLSSNLITVQGATIFLYIAVFYTSLFMIGLSIFDIFKSFPMMSTFYALYVLIGTIAFAYTLIQMGSGSQKMMD